jgi:hypothetical protein
MHLEDACVQGAIKLPASTSYQAGAYLAKRQGFCKALGDSMHLADACV